jgi:hypothetical protein
MTSLRCSMWNLLCVFMAFIFFAASYTNGYLRMFIFVYVFVIP